MRYKSLGCWKDKSSNRAISSLEERNSILDGPYEKRKTPILKCAEAASSYGYKIFALQNGGKCSSSDTATESYDKYGAGDCSSEIEGRGGYLANRVYKIVNGKIGN